MEIIRKPSKKFGYFIYLNAFIVLLSSMYLLYCLVPYTSTPLIVRIDHIIITDKNGKTTKKIPFDESMVYNFGTDENIVVHFCLTSLAKISSEISSKIVDNLGTSYRLSSYKLDTIKTKFPEKNAHFHDIPSFISKGCGYKIITVASINIISNTLTYFNRINYKFPVINFCVN